MSEHLPLIELRELYERQNATQLMAMRAVHLTQMTEHERHVHMINDVMGGIGVVDMAAYDALDDTRGSIEHEEDNQWITKGED